MEKIRLSFFDTFAYLLPGLLTTISISIALNVEIKSIKNIDLLFQEVSTTQLVLIILISYLAGIICNEFGHSLYKLSKKIWKKDVINQKNYRLTDAEIHVLIREYSPINYQYLETWMGLSNMSHNFAVSFITFSLVSIIKLFGCFTIQCYIGWILLIILSILFTIMFLKKSLKFNNYYKADRIAAIEKLYLEKLAEKAIINDEK